MLEDRLVPAITDMTAVAQLFPPHNGPTILYLNFDGNSAQGVSAFQSTTGNTTSDIHEIMYRVEEIFAPFNVQVRRLYGNGNYDGSSNGNSTIFIGDKSGNGTGTSNGAYAMTPWIYADFPGQVKGITHQPNSDPFDLAYVDPIYYSGGTTASWSNAGIARAIAHEAGHTFGLAHVLSNPDDEIMSYDDSNVLFVNKTFNITDLNNNGTSTTHDPDHAPEWYVHYDFGWFSFNLPVTITTQNSFTFLKAVLGARPVAGDFANVADSGAVDPSYADGSLTSVSPGADVYAYLQQTGDYDVYNLSSSSFLGRWVTIDVKRPSGSSVDPVVMVFNSSGQSLQYFNDDGGGYPNSRITFWQSAGQNYKIVVGAYGNNSSGQYELVVSSSWIYGSLLTSTTLLTSGSALSTTRVDGAGAGQNLGAASVVLPLGSGLESAAPKRLTGLSNPALSDLAGRLHGLTGLSRALDHVFASGLDVAALTL
jgi:hypothetical protein